MADNATTTARDHFLSVFEKEIATTLRVLRAYPEDKLALQPHPKCKTAKDLAYMIVGEQALTERALTTGPDGSIPRAKGSEPPDTMAGIADAAEAGAKRVVQILKGLSDEQLHKETVKFFVGPKTLGDFSKMEFVWFLLHDQIHHRGQLSIYLRMADGKVPSIYGPTADESWK
jgi:uncharacterized damage-inducible protein DinB